MMYLDPPDAEQTIARLAAEFPGAWLVMDTVSSAMRDTQSRHDAMRHLSRASWFQWACDEPRALERLGYRLTRSRTFFDANSRLVRCIPWPLRLAIRWLRWFPMQSIRGYRLNCLVAATPERSAAKPARRPSESSR